MYATKYNSSRRGTLELDFQCKHCGHRALAYVQAAGHGSAARPLSFDSDHARTSADAQAEASHRADAKRSLGLARCPGCRRRQPQSLGLALVGVALRSALVTACAWLAVFVVSAQMRSAPGWLAPAAWTLGALYTAASLYYLSTASRRVAFESKAPRR